MPFYLSHPDDCQAIVANGITAGEDGFIDIFTDNMVANTIAKDQLLLDRYMLFWITPAGITAELEPSNPEILTAKYQFRIRQSRVDERFVRLMGEHEVIKDRPTAWDYLFWSRRGFKKGDVEEQFQILAHLRTGQITAEQANALLAELSSRINGKGSLIKSGLSARQGAAKVVSALKGASTRLERAWSAVRNFREIARAAKRSAKTRRKPARNPFTDLSK